MCFLFRIIQDPGYPCQPNILGIRLILGIASEKLHDILHAQFADRLAAFDRRLSELALLFLEREDPLLDRVGDGELVDDDVDSLVETVDPVDRLFFDKLQIP